MQTILNELSPGHAVWDLCCDHGLLGIAALESKKFTDIHFSDQLEHAMDRLERQYRRFPQTHFHCGPCEDLSSVLDGNVVIAGIGAERMLKILEVLEDKALLNPSTLILGPQKNESLLDPFLRQKERFYSIKVLEVAERHRQRRIYVLNLKHDSRVD